MTPLPDSLRFEAEARRLNAVLRTGYDSERLVMIERALREAAAKALLWAVEELSKSYGNRGTPISWDAIDGCADRLLTVEAALRSEGTKEGG